jgi:hypothetical protein
MQDSANASAPRPGGAFEQPGVREDAVSTDLVVRFLRATPQQRGAIDRFLRATAEQQAAVERILRGEREEAPRPARRERKAARYVFRRQEGYWEIVYGSGSPFRLQDVLGSWYLDYLLHKPNQAIRAFDLEVAVQPEKGEARSANSFEPLSDAHALREYRRELLSLEAAQAKARAAGKRAEALELGGQIEALELAARGASRVTDTGERARNNVRKALAVVLRDLREGGPQERAFVEHLQTHLSIGHECLYSQPQGRVWE